MRAGRAYLSIGEVLEALKDDFPDISVSKIRFLETEGLIRPERTPSGYRKFFERDLERLRAVLLMQRDSYLPLKVIRERLAAADAAGTPPVSPGPPTEQAPAEAPAPPPAAARPQPEEDLLSPESSVHLTGSDLADATGLELGQVRSLAEFGVICEHSMNGGAYFDSDDLAVARIAQDFLKLGMEPRHLKILRRFAEQEAGMFEQLVSPAMRNRKPEARRQATETLTELARLARALRQAYVRQQLRRVVEG